MLTKVIVLLAVVAAVAARSSPNAEYVNKWLKSRPQSRFSSNIEEDALLDVPGLIKKYGYPQETHTITTSDGYILESHRIPYGRDNNNTPGPRPVVFIMHGLLSSSADFLVLGPGSALAYTLAEAGYDVWLGNARGNYYSRKHVSMDPDSRSDTSFWRFSWDEIGNYDLPAFVDYILETTGQEKLHYVGHSQGGTTFLALNSVRPEYNDKFISFQGLAPASYFNNNNVSMFNSLAPYEAIIEAAAFGMGIGEVFASYDFLDWFRSNYCGSSMFTSICEFGGSGLNDREYFNTTMVPLFMAHAPAGASVRQFAHYGQVIRFNAFRRFNYNIFTNLAVYGNRNPPVYNLNRITVPSYIHYGLSDNEVHYKDIVTLGDNLSNTVGLFRVQRESFNHYDFIWASDAKTLLYDKLVGFMREAESKQ